MSSKKTKLLRMKFEKKYGFTVSDREGESYKRLWRSYKKDGK
jgi:hypothetical protein